MTTTTFGLLQRLADSGIRLALRDGRLSVTGPRHALTDELRRTLGEHRDDIVRFLREQDGEADGSLEIRRADRSGRIPASRAQQQLWLSEQLASGLPVYNMYFAVELRGDLDVPALRGAAGDLMERHEILRTALTEDHAGLVQTIAARCEVPFREHEAEPDGVADLVRSIVSTRFDLSRAPLTRFDLIRVGPRRWTFVVTQHHVVSDGWSTGILKQELSELYRARTENRPPRLAEPTLHYADFACWEEQWLAGEAAERQRAYWRGALADLPPALDLAQRTAREAAPSHRGAGLEFRYDADLLDKVRALCAETGSTLYGALVSAYALLLARTAREKDVLVGSPLAHRPHPDLERSLGLFFHSIALRTRVDEQQTVREFLAANRRTAHDAFAHRDLPFDQVVQAAAPRRSGAHAPVFQTVFLFQTFPDTELELPGVDVSTVPVPTYSAQYDLMFRLRETDGELHGLLTYSEHRFDEDDARRLVTAYRSLVESMCEAPDRPLARLRLIHADSSRQIEEWNSATARQVPARPVHEDILARMAQDPGSPALTFRGRQVTRGEVARGAASVAGGLRAAGLRTGQRVGVLMPRSPELVVVLLGIMAAGLVYVPLDGAAPQSRLETMTGTAECAALVLDDAYEDRCPGFTGQRLRATGLLGAPDRAPAGDTAESAYVIFTSGSTGVPKGVEVTHANLANLFVALDETVRPDDGTVWLSVTAATFDIAVVELLWTLARGIPVVLAENMETLRHGAADPDAPEPVTIPQLVLDAGATAMQATPTLLRSVLSLPRAEEALSRLRLLMVGGEALDLTLARRLKGLGIPRVLNMYGPTETTVWSTAWEVPEDPDRVLVGRPLANTSVHVVDEQLAPLPVGMRGELLIAGAGVARGYVGRPDLTAERFPELPELHAHGPVYRTGDMARLGADGTLELSGRLDNQIKLRGHRIELEDVEQAVNAVPGVAQCVVVLQDDDGHQALVAHYVPRPGATPDDDTLRTALAGRLPAVMVPSVFVATASLPTTSSGKADRKALPAVAAGRPAAASARPAHALEGRLLEVWRRVLGDDGVGVTDDLFEAGGTSVLVARLLSEVREHVHPTARIVDFFSFPSVRAYAAHIGGPAEAGRTAPERTAPDAPAPTAGAAGRRARMQQVAQRRRAHANGGRGGGAA
ncbi:amino acid adenylation domain-containing protein [Streptomyces sp. 5K101]|uniref:non-ribosomal peptide synthetase n=1 Tax=Streptomyces sp. 5K101 TaxID=3390037 RepID=UPI003976CD4F